MSNLHVSLLGKTLPGPVIAASGTFGYGVEYGEIVDLGVLGGVCSKGLTLNPKYGNEGERLLETPSGLINSIGLQNPGVRHFIDNELPAMRAALAGTDTAILANLGGGCIEDYEEGCELLCRAGVDFVELNISCPNVKHGGIAYGVKPESAKEVVSRVRRVCSRPLIVKMSPQAEDIGRMAAACVEAGADALSLVNTFQACAIDLEKRRPVFNGPAVRPIALRMVWQAVGAVDGAVPVIGLGGIASGEDALQFIMAGAAAVQVGTANFADPHACQRITREIDQWMDAHGVNSLDEIRGCARG